MPERLVVTVEQVRRLVAEQLPHLADRPVAQVPVGGWDNHTFRLGDDLLVRLPSAAAYAEAVEKEHRWLPRLAPSLPLPVPVPVERGGPGAGYPFAWSVYRWLEGETASTGRVDDPVALGLDLADFLLALQAVDPTGGPQPGQHNWFRGAPVRTYDGGTREALVALEGLVDTALATSLWERCVAAPWDGVDRWFHGDVAAGNLLVADGRLAAVIDFGTCGVGDPACDLAVAWTLLTPDGRQAFRDRLAVDDDTWDRGRGWALWKALVTAQGALEDDEPAELAASLAVVEAVLAG